MMRGDEIPYIPAREIPGRKPSLTCDEVRAMRRYRDCGESYEALAKRFGVARSTVRRYLTVGAVHHRDVYFNTTYA